MGTDERDSSGSTGSDPTDQAFDAASAATIGRPLQGRTRRAYVPPQLRHLGSVRQLTLGFTGNITDGGALQMKSSREVKNDIVYLDEAGRKKLASELLALRVASYSYKTGVEPSIPADHRSLGFIIEDAPSDAPFIIEQRQVDVYGFASAILATLQEQQQTIARLESQLNELRSKSS